jgi:hypothetical protein
MEPQAETPKGGSPKNKVSSQATPYLGVEGYSRRLRRLRGNAISVMNDIIRITLTENQRRSLGPLDVSREANRYEGFEMHIRGLRSPAAV